MKLLHVDASILGDASVSRILSAAAVERFRSEDPALTVVTRDLAAAPLGHLTGAHAMAARAGQPVPPAIADDYAEGERALAEFLDADIVVVGAPMYNFSVPSQLKAWLDRVLVAGKTFRYGENGPVGLAGGKRVVIALSRGGFYGADTPMAAFEHVESYLKAAFGFIGVTDVEVLLAEGVMAGPGLRDQAVEKALGEARALAA